MKITKQTTTKVALDKENGILAGALKIIKKPGGERENHDEAFEFESKQMGKLQEEIFKIFGEVINIYDIPYFKAALKMVLFVLEEIQEGAEEKSSELRSLLKMNEMTIENKFQVTTVKI